MKIFKTIECSQEVEIEIGYDDIRVCLENCPSAVESERIVTMNLNRCAEFMKAIPDRIISDMGEDKRKITADFFKQQAQRFEVKEGR